jgi:small conductance mechanosensitive channel
VVNWLSQHGIRILLILFLGLVLYYFLRRFVPPLIRAAVVRGMREAPPEEIDKNAKTVSDIMVRTGSAVILIGLLFTIVSELGVNIAPALAGLGVAGLAIGIGAQGLVRDIIGGLFIILENQYNVGDVVRIAGIAGLVEDISLRRTILRDLDGIVHSVPNGEIRVASNFTKGWSRVNLNVSVAYGENLDRVFEVINRVGKEMAEDPYWGAMILTPPQALRVDDLGDSGIIIKILGETKPIKQWEVMGELRKRIKQAFDEAGIEIPWPHTKVYFGNLPAEWVPREGKPSSKSPAAAPPAREAEQESQKLPPESTM